MKAQGICYKVKPAFVFGSDTTYEHNREVEIPITSTTYINPIQVDWGDGTVETYSSGTYLSHTYDTDDDDAEYTIRITSASGRLPCLAFGDEYNRQEHLKSTLTLLNVSYSNTEWYANNSKITANNTTYFTRCENTDYVHSGIFRNDTQRGSYTQVFAYTQITGVGKSVFLHNTNNTSFSSSFKESHLAEIHSSIFRNNKNVVTFEGTFNGTYLTSIPDGLFDHNTTVTTFQSVFYYCRVLTSIPEGLFDNNTAVTTFRGAFDGCTVLTSIPDGLFDHNTAVTSFRATFSACRALTSIPEGLFDNNTAVTSFQYTFENCTLLSGTAPDLWNATKYPLITENYQCFHNCTNLTNYADIPDGWK